MYTITALLLGQFFRVKQGHFVRKNFENNPSLGVLRNCIRKRQKSHTVKTESFLLSRGMKKAMNVSYLFQHREHYLTLPKYLKQLPVFPLLFLSSFIYLCKILQFEKLRPYSLISYCQSIKQQLVRKRADGSIYSINNPIKGIEISSSL